MTKFESFPLVRDTGDGKTFVLEEPLVYHSKDGRTITVPEGFITDFASIPIGLRNIYGVTGKHNAAAVLHDFIYCHRGVVPQGSQYLFFTREEADKKFLEAMEALGVGWLKRRSMYRGVRIGGWLPWNKKEKKCSTQTT